MSYRLAEGVERVEIRSGSALLSRMPLRVVRLDLSLARLVERGRELIPRSPAEARALASLFHKGLLRREPGAPLPAERLPTITVIVPVKDRADELRRCVESLSALRYPPDKLEIVVVDDGSRDASADVARSLGASVVPSGGEGRGPAAARNRGAAVAEGEILAFIDSDCAASEGWLAELAEEFEDAEVVAVGGRVEGMHAASALDRYEAEMSSLCLGRRDRSGQAGNDTFYLPSCNLLVRRQAFAASRGFREELHVGEDVDLTWRLRDAGGKIVYTPRGRVFHEHRSRLWPFLRRRFQYGTSEGLLQLLHPERRKKMVLPVALAAAAALAVLSFLTRSWPFMAVGAGVLLVDAARLSAKLRRERLRLPFRSILAARLRACASLVYYLSFHLTRYYAPALIIAGFAWPRLGSLFAILAVWSGAVDHAVRRPPLRFPAFFGLYLAEHLSYGAGVFWGCLRQGTFGSYRPLISAKD
jgi:mycofactocin system glycosyltransferase